MGISSDVKGVPAQRAKRKEKKNYVAVKTLPTSIKEKRIPWAEAPCILSTKKRNKVNADQEGY
eukprot:1139419-Pelagomonas_calceolata.AAC.8